ncbi:uncharacterized protein CBL_11723 [Carabus blaptoides fortunei]
MAAPVECSTADKLEYQFHPNSSGFQQFRVRASNDAHLALTNGPGESDPMYEIFIGGWGNTKSVIRRNRTKPEKIEAETPGILNGDEFRGFWVRWGNGSVAAGREGEGAPFVEWHDPEPFQINHIGVCTGWGACGNWILEQPRTIASGGHAANVCWVAAESGNLPPSAFQGGDDNGEPMFVARAHFQGGLIPGKLVPSHGCCYVAWGGAENPVPEYEVLCECNGRWVRAAGADIPPNAVTGGQSEDGEPLYVGRVAHEGSVTTGKVQPSHGVCYIAYGGQELAFPDYEVLVA